MWTKLFGSVIAGFIGLVLFVLVLAFIGLTFDGAAERQQLRNDCLKHATNGYDIEQCR